MNPIEINIKVGLEDSTLEILTALMTAAVRTEDKKPQDPVKEAKEAVARAEQAVAVAEQKTATIVQKSPKSAQKPAEIAQKPAEVEQKNPEVAEPAPVMEDMPDFGDGQPAMAEISDTDLRAVVTETRQRVGSAAPIRAMMAEKFGIKVSTDCPQEKRHEFINELKAL